MRNTSENIRKSVAMILERKFCMTQFTYGLQLGRLISLSLYCPTPEDEAFVDEAIKEIEDKFKELNK